MRRRWLERPAETDAAALAAALGIPLLLAGHLARRGLCSPDDATRFLAPRLADLADPRSMAGMAAAVERLARAVAQHETVGLCGDYDVDGVTSTTLLTEVLRHYGINPILYIPHRVRDGYGLNHAAVKVFAERGTRLLITLDCGVTAHSEVQAAVDAGMDVIVIDHHTVPVTLPRAVAVLNPHRPDCAFPYKQLCAVGVTFMLAVALRAALRGTGAAAAEPDLREHLDLVTLGTIADLVPLTGQNRVLVAQGLGVLRQARRLGVRELARVSNVNLAMAEAGDVAFQLAPRINAAGRLQDAMLGVELLLATDPARAAELATVLDGENRTRRETEKRTVETAAARALEPPHAAARALVLYDEEWHPGVVGIAAQKMVEQFHKPSILVGAGGKGSGRSIEAFHLHDALARNAGLLQGFGGHAHAAGLRVDPKKVDAFREAFYSHAMAVLSPEDLLPRSHHDGVLPLAALTDQTVETLARAAPFGRSNAEPCFLVERTAVRDVRPVGKTGEHLQLWFGGNARAIAFRMGPDAAAMQAAPADFLMTPRMETWQGVRRMKLQVRDWRPAGEAAP
ncbi:MAG: single-stranded-DNA-specific exonuclease RecJ [Deltaproteobacteria bacterium]|nr:single-stranded-DNA-specific exonuclease RecJ [Deltaproteobacteria bacterium]